MERPFLYIRQDFFLARTFRNIDDLNAQFEAWRSEIANPRVHATTDRVVDEAFAEERPHLIPLPALPYSTVLTVEWRVSHEGMVSVDGNHYSVPDTTRTPDPGTQDEMRKDQPLTKAIRERRGAPDRRRQLPAPKPRRSHSGARPLQGTHLAATATKAMRQAA